jgi:L-ornithine Nalpha-acyltransferase
MLSGQYEMLEERQMNIALTHGVEPGILAAPPVIVEPPILGQIGSLTARLVRTEREIAAVQELRHRVFFAASPNARAQGLRESDCFDDQCDHLIVADQSIQGAPEKQIIGAYRLLRQERAGKSGFSSQSEFDVESLVSRHPGRRFLELGRSCVLPEFRSTRTAELLWQGIWAYCRMHAIDVMFGCASFPGTSPARHALPLSFLYHHARAAGEWGVEPVSGSAVLADLVPAEAVSLRQALAAMPPLIKGYLRLGAKFSGSAVIDPHFGTTDVLVVLRTEDISDRYLNHYGHEAERFA